MKYLEPTELNNKYTAIQVMDSSSDVLLIRENVSGLYFIKRTLSVDNLKVYEYLDQLNSPGTPHSFYFTYTDGHPVIIEEYIPGKSLEELLNENGPLDCDTCIDYLLQLCDILIPLHRNNPAIVHRDIKPSNVILSNDGKIHLIDFDAATLNTSEKDRDTVLLGTQGYAAPEQYGFTAARPQSDIYALGRLGMELLTGDAVDSSDYSGPFNTILKRCTNMNPDSRYRDALELKKSLLSNKKNPSGFKLPGYRSGNKTVTFFATIAYAFLPFMTLLNLLTGNYQNVIFGILLSVSAVLLGMILFNYRDYLRHLPFTSALNPFVKTTSRILYMLIISTIVILALGIAADFL